MQITPSNSEIELNKIAYEVNLNQNEIPNPPFPPSHSPEDHQTKIKIDQTSETKNIEVIFNENENDINYMLKHLRNETIKIFLKIFETENKWLRLYLVILMTFLTCLSSYMLINSIVSYLAFEQVSQTNTIIESESVFPQVTICNSNIFQTEYALNLLKMANEKVCSDPKLNLSQYFCRQSFFDIQSISSVNDLKYLGGLIYERGLQMVFDSNFTNEERKQLGHDLSDLIYNCQFSGEECFIEQDFNWYFDRDLGNCYLFNTGFNSTGDRVNFKKTNSSGEDGALSLDFYVGVYEKLILINSLYGNSNGAVIRIENNSYLTDPNSVLTKNVRLMAGSQNFITIHRSFEFSLAKPYSNCDVPNDEQEAFIQTNFLYRLFSSSLYQYSQQSCLVQCWQQHLIKNCSCTDGRCLSLFSNESVCLTDEQFKCQLNYYWSYFVGNKNVCYESDICRLECNQTKYEISLSSLKLNGEYYALQILFNQNLANDFVTQQITSEVGANSFIRLKIYYDTLNYDLTEEKPKMSVVDLLASIGGNLGLFLGVSIFSLCELLEIFLEVNHLRKRR